MDEEKIIANGKIDLGRIYLEVVGDTPAPILEEKSVTILENGESEITPSEGYDGLSKVNLVVSTPEGVNWSVYGLDEQPYLIDQMQIDGTQLKNEWSNVQTTTYSQYDYNSGEYRYMSMFPQVDTSNLTILSFYNCSYLLAISDNLDYSSITTFNNFCNSTSIFNAPKIKNFPSAVRNCTSMFAYCNRLVKVPIYDLTNVTNVYNMFYTCNRLDDESLDNILQSLILATGVSNKTLNNVGINNSSRYPVSRMEALPHYQDFIDAGWSLGYS